MSDKQPTLTESLNYLIETDGYYGEAVGLVKWLEHKLKVVHAQEYLKAEGSVEQRKSIALSSEAYEKTLDDYKNACLEREEMSAKRKSRELVIEVWRTQQANRRSGNI